YNKNTFANGYEVRILKKGKNIEKQRVSVIYDKIKKDIDSFGMVINVDVDKDSIDYYSEIMRQADEIDYLENRLIDPENFILDHQKAEKEFFFSDYLHIKYKKKVEDEEYIKYTRENRKPLPPISVI